MKIPALIGPAFLSTALCRFLLVFVSAFACFLALAGFMPPPVDLAVEPARDLPLYAQPFGPGYSPFYPAELSTPDNKLVNWRAVPGARECGACHPKETLEWATSIHAISDRDIIYDSTVMENTTATKAAQAHGVEKGRWCEACHNPLGVVTGAVTPANSVQEVSALEEGTACIVCHAVNSANPQAGNGALEIDINGVFRYAHPSLIAAAPSRHARDMRARRDQPLMGDSALCGACHTEIRPTSVNDATPPLNLQDTYEEWRHSPYASDGIHCQDCHMAADPAGFVAALKRGERPKKTVSHRFVGNNYLLSDASLPTPLLNLLRGGSPPELNRLYDRPTFNRELGRTHDAVVALLREAADVSVTAVPEKKGLSLAVTVTNAGAGHALPTGPLDQRYLWLEIHVRDANGRTLYHRGAFDDKTGTEDTQATRWMKIVRDTEDGLDLRHLLFDAFSLRYTRRPIPPRGTDTVQYHIPLPDGTAGEVSVEVRLWYRLAVQDILKNIESQGLGKVDVIVPPLLLKEVNQKARPHATDLPAVTAAVTASGDPS
jgi:hypothetical protein